MYFEGSLDKTEEALREPLYEALRTGDGDKITPFLEHPVLQNIIALADDGEKPTIGMALRLLRPGKMPLLLTEASDEMKMKWPKLVKDLTALLKMNSEDSLTQYYYSQPWTAFREEYKKNKVSCTRGVPFEHSG